MRTIFEKLFKGAAATAVATCVTYPLQIVQARARVTDFIIFFIDIIIIFVINTHHDHCQFWK